MVAIWIVVGILAMAVLFIGLKLYSIKNEMDSNRYIIVEKNPDGTHILKNSKGEIIFEL